MILTPATLKYETPFTSSSNPQKDVGGQIKASTPPRKENVLKQINMNLATFYYVGQCMYHGSLSLEIKCPLSGVKRLML